MPGRTRPPATATVERLKAMTLDELSEYCTAVLAWDGVDRLHRRLRADVAA